MELVVREVRVKLYAPLYQRGAEDNPRESFYTVIMYT